MLHGLRHYNDEEIELGAFGRLCATLAKTLRSPAQTERKWYDDCRKYPVFEIATAISFHGLSTPNAR